MQTHLCQTTEHVIQFMSFRAGSYYVKLITDVLWWTNRTQYLLTIKNVLLNWDILYTIDKSAQDSTLARVSSGKVCDIKKYCNYRI